MPTDPNLNQSLEMLDGTVEPEEQQEFDIARLLAERLGLPFDSLDEFHVDPELFRTIPVERSTRRPVSRATHRTLRPTRPPS